MRLWSLSPSYLDPAGLVAAWREALLAQKVLHNETRGYRHHPQLKRFRAEKDPGRAIAAYLWGIWDEACVRGYHFDHRRIRGPQEAPLIPVHVGQLLYEWELLCFKLKERAPTRLPALDGDIPRCHPLFFPVEGGVHEWEKLRSDL